MGVTLACDTSRVHHYEEQASHKIVQPSCPVYIHPKEPCRSISDQDNDTSVMIPTTRETINLQALPPEILLQITSYLSHPSLISLKLTSRILHNATPALPRPRPQDLSLCARVALRRYLAERADHAAGKRWCTACQMLQSANFFHRPISVPLCNWHDGWTMSPRLPKYLEPDLVAKLQLIARTRSSPCWVPVRRLLCGDCLKVRNWDVGTATGGGSGGVGTSDGDYSPVVAVASGRKPTSRVPQCACSCPDCGVFDVLCWVRVAPLPASPYTPHSSMDGAVVDIEPRSWEWPREWKGKLVVTEGYRFAEDPRHSYWKRIPVLPCEENENLINGSVSSDTLACEKDLGEFES